MSVQNITHLLDFCLNNTFTFQGQEYEQREGVAIWSPVSPGILIKYMGEFENKALNKTYHPPRIWKRFVDDTFVIQDSQHKDKFLQHIKAMQFTTEGTRPDGGMPFLDIIKRPKPDVTLTTGVCRELTHIDQYLQ